MTDPVLEACGVSRTYSVSGGLFGVRRSLHAVSDVSFTLNTGRTLAVVGESGSGKSTLARLACILEPPDTGTVLLGGEPTRGIPKIAARVQRRTVQMVFQNPYTSLNPRKTAGQTLAEPLAIAGRPRAERRERVAEALNRVGLRPDGANRYPHQFSGGQRQRIAIARALMASPRVIVADEPVSALDISIQAQVLNLLMDLRDEFGLAYLFISHNLSVVRHIADEVLVLYLGRAVEVAPKVDIFARPLHPYTRALLAATPRVDEPSIGPALAGELPSPLSPPRGCAFHTRCLHATPLCSEAPPPLRDFGGRLVACHYAEQFS